MLSRSKRAVCSCKAILQLTRGARGANLPLVLSKDIPSLGSAGDHVRVSPGFARNWLLPQRLAVYDQAAKHGSRKPRDHKAPQEQGTTKATDDEHGQLARIVNKLLGSPVVIKRKKKRGHILEGQVTTASIVDAIAKSRKIDIPKELVELKAPLIEHGTFEVPLGILMPDGERAILRVLVTE